jgi:hypothetical protein
MLDALCFMLYAGFPLLFLLTTAMSDFGYLVEVQQFL